MPRSAANPRLPLPSRNTLRVAVLAALSAAPVLQAATVLPGGALDTSEFLVFSETAGIEQFPHVARDAAGDFVVAWVGAPVVTGSDLGIYAQRYNAAGKPQGSTVLAGSFVAGTLISDAVAMDAAGDFVVVWAGYDPASPYEGVFARQYNAAGTALQASEFLVDTFTSAAQRNPSVAMDAAGDFVVAWESYGQASSGSSYDVYARQYSASGTPLQASEFLVNTITSNAQINPSAAMDAAGDFVVAWETAHVVSNAYHGDGIYARQYNAAGTPLLATEFLVNTFTSSGQAEPSVAMDAIGDFVVAWESNNQAASNSGYDIYARQFNASGTALHASEFLVNTYTSNTQAAPSVAMDAAGDFVIAWPGQGQGSNSHAYDIYARQYAASGTPLQASEFLVNALKNRFQETSGVAMDAAGDSVIAWLGLYANQDNIYARRFEGPESVNLAATLGTSPTSVSADGATTLTLGVNNNTPATTSYSNADINAAFGVATGITAVFTLPTGATAGTVGGTGWSCGSQSGSSLTCNYSGSLAATSAASALTIGLTAGGPSTQAVQVDVTSTQQDSDSSDNTASAALTVNDVVPTAISGHFTTNAGTGINGTLVATPGYTGQALSYAVVTGPAHAGMLVTPSTGAFTYTPNRGFVGTDSFTFTVSDGTVTSSPATVSIAVNDVVPQAVSGGAVTTVGTEVTKILVANPGYIGQPLSYRIVAQPAHGSVHLTASSGLFTYTPASGFSGADSFKFTVSDGTLTSNAATESITVNAASGGGSSGGGGSFGLLSLAFLGLPLFGRRRRYGR